MASPWEYIFNAKADPAAPTSYSALEARRKIAMAMMSKDRRGYPKNFGEGLTAIGDALGDRGIMNQLMEAEQSKALQDQEVLKGTGIYGPAPAAGQQQSESVTPVRTAYAPTDDVQDKPAVTTQTPLATADLTPEERTADVQGGGFNPLDAAAPARPAGYQPAPAYLQPALARLVRDPERQAYLGQLAGKEAQSAGEVSPTGAAGPFQFTRSTGRQYGLVGQGGDQRTNIDASILAANKLTDDNVATLTARLGRPPTPGEMALAHQQGAVTAARMLTGAGNAPPNNLAVNNVNPAASPQAAAARIMGYYGMPGQPSANPRDAIAAQLAARQAAPAASVALPLSATTPTPGLPPEITEGRSAIRVAPPPPSQIQPAPVQVAQVAQTATTLRPPVVPQPTPQMLAIDRALAVIGDPIQRDALTRKYQELQSGQMNTYNQQMKDYQDQQTMDRQRLLAREAFERTQGTPENVAAADIYKRTGKSPAQFFPEMDKEKANIDQTVRAQDAQRLARKAVNDGVITGYGANMRIARDKFAAWAWNNGLKGTEAANTETMSAALKAGLSEAVKTVNGEGGTGVSNTDVRIAEGIAGSDPELQMKTIQSIMDRAAAINHSKINRYEQEVDKYLSGHPQELRYSTNARPTAPPAGMKMLFDAQADPTRAEATRNEFDKWYGPGAAELEIARFERARRRRRD